jgi:hypothetical protein
MSQFKSVIALQKPFNEEYFTRFRNERGMDSSCKLGHQAMEQKGLNLAIGQDEEFLLTCTVDLSISCTVRRPCTIRFYRHHLSSEMLFFNVSYLVVCIILDAIVSMPIYFNSNKPV